MQIESTNPPPVASMITWPAPAGEIASPDFPEVSIAGTRLFVYQAPVRAEILPNGGLASHKPDYASERASFVLFDMSAPVTVRVVPARPFKTVSLRPERAGIAPRIVDGAIEFTLDRPRKLTLILDGDSRMALHLLAGEPEKDVPSADDPNVLYFGPGVHETTGIELKSGQTIYLAGGAVLKAKLKPGEKGTYSEKWKVVFHNGNVFGLKKVDHVRICGRGIVDASDIPHPGWNMLAFDGAKHVQIEGITLRNAANWNFVIGKSEDVEVSDVRIISGRLNSDGINSVNSRRVHIHDCFVRNHDDSIVVKTTAQSIPAEDIKVERCTIWNDWGFALGVTYETRSPVRNIVFRNNDIVFSRHWIFGIHVSDGSLVENVTFTDTAVSDLDGVSNAAGSPPAWLSPGAMLFRGTIQQDCWGHDAERGRVRNVLIDGVTLYGKKVPPSELYGADAAHDIRGVAFRNIRVVGQPPVADLAGLSLKKNGFVSDVTCRAAPAWPVSVREFAPVKPVSRAKRATPIVAVLHNAGPAAEEVGIQLVLPPEVRCLSGAVPPKVRIEAGMSVRQEWVVEAGSELTCELQLRLEGKGEVVMTPLSVYFLPPMAITRPAYIPEPTPAKSRVLIGAHHCPLWEADKPAMWDNIIKHPERTPALGFYNQENPEVSDWETLWAVEHGIDFFVYCWYRTSQGGPVTTRFSSAIHEAFFKSRYRDMMKFTIMWENQSRGKAGIADEKDLTTNLLPFWIENYFKHPSYLKIDNKPVLFIYRPAFLVDDLGSVEKVAGAIDLMRKACRDAGFAGLLVLGENRNVDPRQLTLMKQMGLDYSFAYCWHVQNNPTPVQAIDAQLKSMEEIQKLGIMPQVPTVSQAWSGWRDEGSIWKLPPTDFETLLRRTDEFMTRLPATELGSRMLLLDNWNEWGEGHYLLPYREYGFGYLDAVRKVFTAAPAAHSDLIPEDIGRGPYDTAIRALLEKQAKP